MDSGLANNVTQSVKKCHSRIPSTSLPHPLNLLTAFPQRYSSML